jgi:hypothetical protein
MKKMSNQSQTLIFTNLVFTNSPIPICDDILSKLLARQCNKHGKIEYCNVIGSKNIGFVKFQLVNDAIFVKKLMNNQLLFKSIVNINFLDDNPIKTQRFFKPLRIENGVSKIEPIKIQKVFTITENGDSKIQQRDRISKLLEDLLKN